jgi:hypothetical protein
VFLPAACGAGNSLPKEQRAIGEPPGADMASHPASLPGGNRVYAYVGREEPRLNDTMFTSWAAKGLEPRAACVALLGGQTPLPSA